jgi:hypothetical protein
LDANNDGFCGYPGFVALEPLLKGFFFQNAKLLPPLWQPASPTRAIATNA